MDKLKKLVAKVAEINGRIDALLAHDELTAEQQAEHDSLVAEHQKAVAAVAREQARLAREAEAEQLQATVDAAANRQARTIPATPAPGTNRLTDAASNPTPTAPATPRDPREVATWGFPNFGAFAAEVHRSTISQRPSQRIITGFEIARSAAATGMGEAIGSDGGFLVPQEFSSRIFERMYDGESLLSRTDQYPVAGNSISFPRNAETSRATGSRWGGVQTYWRGEGGTPTATKPTFGKLTLTLHKLISMGVISDELLEDAGAALEQYLFRCFGDEITFTVNDSLINGTGAGMPLGVLQADCTVSVSKETGQSAATVNATNILKMWSRMFARCRSAAAWFINQDVEPQLYSMQIGTGVANQVVYMPPGGLSQAPYATLMGRPVIPTEYNPTLGTVGDIMLVDFSQWATAIKSGGTKQEVSMHLYFDRDEQAFRVTYRVDSQPWWPAALTPFKGSATQSCAVTLATRA